LGIRRASAVAALAMLVSAGPVAAAMADDIVAQAKAEVAKLTESQTTWTGPTSGPKTDPGKLIVYMSQDQQNDAAVKYGNAVKDAAALVGWKVVVVDGRGTASGALEATNQAIALKPDAIIISSDAAPLTAAMKTAEARGIVIVGIHSAATPGPQPAWGMYYNVQTDAAEIGKAQADWIIANSDGKGRVVVTTDCSAGIACTKATATKDEIQKCTTCTLLEFNSSPFGEAQQRQPALVAAWVQKYGLPIYITAVGDYIADFQAPALRAGGVDPKQAILVASDGNKSAYQRIRAGNQYQQVTIPEPIEMQGYQTIDEINRALHHLPPSVFQQTPYLVEASNIHAEGGDQDGYDPSNDYVKHYKAIWGVN
jgi:ribose transport system substrate-binding protein